MQRLREQPQHQLARDARGGRKVRAGAATLRHERHGDGGQAEKAALDGRSDRARVEHVVPEVGAVVDARYDHVELEFEQARDRKVDTVGRRAVDHVPGVLVHALHAQRHLERQ